MAHELPPLPFEKNALAPHISEKTLEYHYGKHHAGYVAKLNAAVDADPSLAGKSIEDLVRTAKGGVFNNAAQVYNHTFYWNSMAPGGGGEPTGPIADAIASSFGSFGDFKEAFSKAALGHFGSGWAWLVEEGGQLAVLDTHDAGNPLTQGKTPILTCDVWEHAYYLDRQNARGDYVEAWWNLVSWDFANANLSR